MAKTSRKQLLTSNILVPDESMMVRQGVTVKGNLDNELKKSVAGLWQREFEQEKQDKRNRKHYVGQKRAVNEARSKN